MSRRWIIGLAVAAALSMPIAVRAHEGHTHKALGTVGSVHGTQVEVKTTDGKLVVVVVDAKTAVTRGKDKVDVTALRTGERVSVDYTQAKNVNTAKTIKLGTAPAPKK